MRALLFLLLMMLPRLAGAERLTVVELFTSQGCSSCPPAEAVLAELARSDPAVLPLGMHITYWDRLGWKDPFSLAAATERQREASRRMRLDTIYTPQMIVDGTLQAVGSDRAAVHRVIATARAAARAEVPLSIVAGPAGLRVTAGVGAGRGRLLLIGFDAQHSTPVKAGENGGRTLAEVNVVRALVPVGDWSGQRLELVVPRPSGDRAAVLLQAEDGHILAAAAL